MQLHDLAGKYDAVFSLGQNCLPASQMQQNGLRLFGGMLDWVLTDHLSDVNRLLSNGFDGFMELENMKIKGSGEGNLNLTVEDVANRIVSMHDFSTTHNTLTELHTYPEFKLKMNRRIARFYEKAATCQRILYIRMLGEYEEVRVLQSILMGIVKNDFRILIVNYSPHTQGIIDLNWPLDNVSAVMVSSQDIWSGANWKTMLQGVKVL